MMKGFREQGRWRHAAGALAAFAILFLLLAPMLPHDREAALALAQEIEDRDHHAAHHYADAPTDPPHEHAAYLHCPLCTVAKVFVLPEPMLLVDPFRRQKAHPALRPAATEAAPVAGHVPQQPRAPPRTG